MAAKKSNTKASSKSKTAKTTESKSRTSDANKYESNAEAKRQIFAIVLLAVSLLLTAIVFIPSGGAWNWLRIALFGLFGFAAYILPFIFIALDIMILMGRMTSKLAYKIVEALILISLLVAFVHIVEYDALIQKGFGEQFIDAFNTYRLEGSTAGSGCLGALIGGGVLAITGGDKLPAGIITSLLIFVFLMLFTGTTLINLFNGIKKPAKRIEEYTEDKIHMFREAASRSNENGDDFDELAAVADKAREKRKKHTVTENPETSLDIDIALDTKPSKDMGIDSIFSEAAKNKVNNEAGEPAFLRLINEDGAKGEQASLNNENIFVKAQPQKQKSKQSSEKDITETKSGKQYILPPLELLREPVTKTGVDFTEELQSNAKKIVETLNSFGVSTKIVDICRSPSVTRYELQPDAGVKISRITSLSDDLALNLAAAGVRIEAPIPNKAAIGIEVPNKERNPVLLKELIDTVQYRNAKSKLNVAIGRDIQGAPTYADISKMPHLLIAGTTGSGKSVCLNTMIVSLLYNATPQEVKLILIDPKMVEFSIYSGIPHLLVPVVADPRKASGALCWAVTEMEKRYKLFSEQGVRNLAGYNDYLESKGEEMLPRIVIFIDELADLMMVASNEVESSICRLAQKARAAGMHFVVATQRPSVDVITGIIKANIPSRLALSVSSQVDSRTILDSVGAEKLLGNGDMLFCPIGMSKPVRLQGAYVSDNEIEAIVDHIKSQEKADYDDEVIEEIERQAAIDGKKRKGAEIFAAANSEDDSDELLPDAVEVVLEVGMASTTLLQRKLKLGYARAARIIDDLEEKRIIGPFEGSRPRKVLITKEQWYEMNALSSTEPSKSEKGNYLSSSDYEEDIEDITSETNYFGGYTNDGYEDIYSSSYSDENESDD